MKSLQEMSAKLLIKNDLGCNGHYLFVKNIYEEERIKRFTALYKSIEPLCDFLEIINVNSFYTKYRMIRQDVNSNYPMACFIESDIKDKLLYVALNFPKEHTVCWDEIKEFLNNGIFNEFVNKYSPCDCEEGECECEGIYEEDIDERYRLLKKLIKKVSNETRYDC